MCAVMYTLLLSVVPAATLMLLSECTHVWRSVRSTEYVGGRELL